MYGAHSHLLFGGSEFRHVPDQELCRDRGDIEIRVKFVDFGGGCQHIMRQTFEILVCRKSIRCWVQLKVELFTRSQKPNRFLGDTCSLRSHGRASLALLHSTCDSHGLPLCTSHHHCKPTGNYAEVSREGLFPTSHLCECGRYVLIDLSDGSGENPTKII